MAPRMEKSLGLVAVHVLSVSQRSVSGPSELQLCLGPLQWRRDSRGASVSPVLLPAGAEHGHQRADRHTQVARLACCPLIYWLWERGLCVFTQNSF